MPVGGGKGDGGGGGSGLGGGGEAKRSCHAVHLSSADEYVMRS